MTDNPQRLKDARIPSRSGTAQNTSGENPTGDPTNVVTGNDEREVVPRDKGKQRAGAVGQGLMHQDRLNLQTGLMH